MAEQNRNSLERLFDRLSLQDDLFAKPNSPLLKVGRLAVERLDLRPEDEFLEVGCGTGQWTLLAASICKVAVGVDISQKSLNRARAKAAEEGLSNILFAYGSFQNPSEQLDLSGFRFNKILLVYSLHHLQNPEKERALSILIQLLCRPGRLAIGDLFFFQEPIGLEHLFPEVGFDGGETDFPASPFTLEKSLKSYGAEVLVDQIGPLQGVLTAICHAPQKK